MKKLVLSAVLASACLGNAWAGDPLKIELSDSNIQFTSLADNITINNIVANRGNCKLKILTKEEREKIGYDNIKAEYDRLDSEYNRLKAEYYAAKENSEEEKRLQLAGREAYDKSVTYYSQHRKVLSHDLVLPVVMKFAQKLQISHNCGDILELQFTTDKGGFKYGSE